MRRRRGRARRGLPRNLLSLALSSAAAALLVAGLVTESLLYYVATALMSLASLAEIRAWRMQMRMDDRRKGQTIPPRRKRPTGPATSSPGGQARAAESGPGPTGTRQDGPVRCTETNEPTDKCDCASRHVVTEDGARRYGLPVGSPIGRRNAKKT